MEERRSNIKKKYPDKIRRSAGRAINRYGMIRGGDRVAVAVSGGKDSCVLLEILATRRKHMPVSYEVLPVHVTVMGIPASSKPAHLSGLCSELGLSLHELTAGPEIIPVHGESVCFKCTQARRRELFSFCRDHDCNRLAFGHHLDDSLETLLMSMAFNGSISALPPRLPIFSGKLDIIRPLILIPEREINEYARIRGFPVQGNSCPHGLDSSREVVREIINGLEKVNRGARKNLFRSLSNIHYDYLPGTGDIDPGVHGPDFSEGCFR